MDIPKKVETVLSDYMNLMNEHLPGTLEGLYVHGSIALGAYIDDSSDIDFITVTSRPLTKDDSEALLKVHHMIENKYEKPELDGVYIQWGDMGKLYRVKSDLNDDFAFYNDGKLHFGDYFNFNPVTWWTLKNCGIAVLGKDPRRFDYGVTSQDLKTYVRNNMNTYWAQRIQTIEESKDMIMELSPSQISDEIEWTVLGLLRQFCTLKENDIISKLGAGKYGLQELPDKWHPIITEAINIRCGKKSSSYDSEGKRISDTMLFSKYLMAESNKL